MTTMEQDPTAAAEAARAGDELAFAGFAERHRRELHVHCYRMTGSFDEAEDLVQETFLRAWRRRETYAGRASFRAWLYRIATNACLDALTSRPALKAGEEALWLQPYPDALLEPAAPAAEEPDALVVARETIEIAFLVAIQHLPPRQRAVFLVRDVLGWSAAETAKLLDASVAAANSALQRARETLQKTHVRGGEWAVSEPTTEEAAVVKRYVDALEQADVGAVAGLLAEDVRFWMPPDPEVVEGREAHQAQWVTAFSMGEWRAVQTRANHMPAVACYLKAPGEKAFRRFTLDVLRLEGDRVAEMTTFYGDALDRFALPATL